MTAQAEFDWAYFDRQGWIKQAVLPHAKSRKGYGVSPAVMKAVLNAINDRLGDNVEAWPSRELIAQDMGISVDTVTRATQALESLSLLIIRTETTKGGWRQNYYRIVWTELQVRDPARRKEWLRMLSQPSEPNDMVLEPNDMVLEPNDMVLEPNSMVSDELLTNNSKNNSKNNPPPRPPVRAERRSRATASPTVPSDWVVVVSVLKSLGVSAWQAAINAAIARGLTPTEAISLAERLAPYRRNVDPRANPGYLYRWLSGESQAPTIEECQPKQPPHAEYRAREAKISELKALRYKACRWGREHSKTEEEIALALRTALINRRLPPDAITLNHDPKPEEITI